MLTANGLPEKRSTDSVMHPTLHSHSDMTHDSRYFLSFVNVCTPLSQSVCCKKKYVKITCSLCGIKIAIPADNIEIGYDDVTELIKIVDKIHSHDDVYERIVNVKDNIQRKPVYHINFRGEHIMESGETVENGGNPGIPDNIQCAVCDNPIQFRRRVRNYIRRGRRLDMAELFSDINTGYKTNHKSCIKRFAKKEITEEIRNIFSAAMEYLNGLDERSLPSIPNDHETILINIISRCECGNSFITKCAVCGIERKIRGNDIDDYYEKAVLHHFGKKITENDHTDFITQNRTSEGMTTMCVICGEEYPSPAPKEMVIDHFKQCAEANCAIFAAGGYQCSA